MYSMMKREMVLSLPLLPALLPTAHGFCSLSTGPLNIHMCVCFTHRVAIQGTCTVVQKTSSVLPTSATMRLSRTKGIHW